MVEIEQEMAENYRTLKQERGLTWEQLAELVRGDRRTAAWMREQAEPANPRQRVRTRTTEIA